MTAEYKTMDKTKKVLIIFTGGTIGMKPTKKGYAPVSGWMEKRLQQLNALQDVHGPPRTTPFSRYGNQISYDILEYENPLDSANMEVRHWVKIAKDIQDAYDDYVGFVVLHGTDTMAYTASALSFMLVNLGKTVILTGSQIPLAEMRNDAVDNLLGAITIAGNYTIPEVCLYFNHQLFRGNRVRKIDATGLGAFNSGNFPPLANLGVNIDIAWHLILPKPNNSLRLRTITNQNVASFRLFPGITSAILKNFLQPPMKGVVLETYGSGNFPSTRTDLLSVIRESTERGLIIVNCTQCFRGSANTDYECSSILEEQGVISGGDMTPEAALTKLAYLLSQPEITNSEIKRLMPLALRGEITGSNLSINPKGENIQRIETLTQFISRSCRNQLEQNSESNIATLMLGSAAENDDLPLLMRLIKQQPDLNNLNHNGRGALHIACEKGHYEIAKTLLDNGADINLLDSKGNSPLRDSIRHQHKRITKLLRDKGAII